MLDNLDFNVALSLCHSYATRLARLGIHDPDWVQCRNLCIKYGLTFESFDSPEPTQIHGQLTVYDEMKHGNRDH